MTTICIIVATVSGLWCAESAQPVGQCIDRWYGQECRVDNLPVYLSTYDPAICGDHPTNCSNQDDPWQSATRRLSPDDYGNVAACPIDWIGKTLTIPGIPLSVECLDTGGRIKPMWRQVWTFDGQPELVWMWVIVVDILWNHDNGWPWFSLQSWDEWELS